VWRYPDSFYLTFLNWKPSLNYNEARSLCAQFCMCACFSVKHIS
jgi:hypothetical protein